MDEGAAKTSTCSPLTAVANAHLTIHVHFHVTLCESVKGKLPVVCDFTVFKLNFRVSCRPAFPHFICPLLAKGWLFTGGSKHSTHGKEKKQDLWLVCT